MDATDAQFGLLWAMAFDADGCGRRMSPAEAARAFEAFGSGFVWMHYDLAAAGLGPRMESGRLGPRALAAATFGPDEHQRVIVEGLLRHASSASARRDANACSG